MMINRTDDKDHETLLRILAPKQSKSGFRCQECGRSIPIGRYSCPKCKSTDIDLG